MCSLQGRKTGIQKTGAKIRDDGVGKDTTLGTQTGTEGDWNSQEDIKKVRPVKAGRQNDAMTAYKQCTSQHAITSSHVATRPLFRSFI